MCFKLRIIPYHCSIKLAEDAYLSTFQLQIAMANQLDNCMDKVYDIILVWLDNHTRNVAKSFCGLISVFVLLSCSHGKYDFEFKPADQALKCYQAFCDETKGKKSITSKEAVPVLQKWHEVRDTVLSFLQKDSAYYAHSWIPGKYSSIDDSIRFHLLNTMLEQNYSLKDVAIIKRGSSLFIDDKEVKESSKEIQSFFSRLDSVTTYYPPAPHDVRLGELVFEKGKSVSGT